MSEENGNQAGADESSWKAPANQEEFNRMVADRLDRERSKFADYEDLKTKAEQFDQLEQANKSELQKLQERAEAAEGDLSQLRLESDRNSVALEKGLTASQAKRLIGSTREELAADADQLLQDLTPEKKSPPVGSLKSGSGASALEGLTGRERAAAALRDMRKNNN